MSDNYTKDLIENGKNLYAVEPKRTDREKLKHLLNCANNTQTAIHSSLQELGTMMWMASNSNGTEDKIKQIPPASPQVSEHSNRNTG